MREPRPLRVLLLIDEMEVGGTQRQIVNLARNVDRRRIEPAVAYFRNASPLAPELREAGVPVTEIPKRAKLDPVFVARLARFVGDGGFDVLHAFGFTGELWGTVARRCLPRARRPALVTSVRSRYEWYSRLQWRLKAWAAAQSRRVVSNSRDGADYAADRMGMERGRIDVVYNGVADRRPAPPPGDGAPALFVGRLVEHKNVPLLVDAASRLRDAGTALRVQIAGDGPLRAACEARIRALGVGDRVAMLGERSDVPALMDGAQFVVQPSLREGLSNSILEAMVAARPVVASAIGGNRELVEDGRTGLLFPSGDADALAAAMARLAADPALRERLGRAAREEATARYTLGAMTRAMQECYEAVAHAA